MVGLKTHLLALLRMNLRSSLMRPAATLAQAGFMFANNLIFFIVWMIFFSHISMIRGWRIDDIALLTGVAAWAVGLSMFLAGGVRDIAQAIVNGGLDIHLGRPTYPLPSLLLSRSVPAGLGDMASALIFWFLLAGRGFADLPFLLLTATAATIVIIATMTIVHSTAFWRPGVVQLAEEIFSLFVLISAYPQHVFGIALKLFLFTLFPAAFVGLLPVEAVREGSFAKGLAVVIAAFAYMAIAIWVFERGLRRYTSGNRLLEHR